MKTVLLIDDDPVLRKIMKKMLCKLEFNCIVAGDTHEMFELLENQHVDCIISDLNLKGYERTDILEVLKPLDIPFAVLSGWIENSVAKRLRNAGVAIAEKPITMNELKKLCEVVLDG